MIYKKSQTAIEFIILVGFLLFFFTVFFVAIQESTGEKVKERQNDIVKETAFAIQDEINLAFKSSEGYTREFNVPGKIGNQDYSVSIVEDLIYLKTDDGKNAIALPIPQITGNIVKGANIIKKQNGEIRLN